MCLLDNTFATPVLQNPTVLGATMALHSATKYLGGHGDVVAGVIACDEETASRLRQVRAVTGGLLHPLGADRKVWRPVTERLAAERRSITRWAPTSCTVA